MVELTPLAQEVARVTYEAMTTPDGRALWRGMILGEQWKISVDYDALHEEFRIRVKRRDSIGID